MEHGTRDMKTELLKDLAKVGLNVSSRDLGRWQITGYVIDSDKKRITLAMPGLPAALNEKQRALLDHLAEVMQPFTVSINGPMEKG